METRSNHILVGGVVMALVVAVLAFVIWLSQVSGEDNQRYDIFFKQAVDGLAKGSAVSFSGVPVGQVETISLEPNSPEFVRVRIAVRTSTPVLEGTTATIEGVGFTGVSQIQLDGAMKGARPISQIGPYGAPVIPTKPGALGELLNSAPELLNRLSTLTERLTELLSDRNQNSIAAILENVRVVSGNLAERSDEIASAMADARIAIRQTGDAVEEIGRLANTSNSLLDQQGRPLLADLRKTVQAAETSMHNLDAAIGDARPGLQAFSKQTVPEVGQLVRDLRKMSDSLSRVSAKIDQQGATSILSSPKLPDYEPAK